jgi:hypothetical protein
MIKRSRLTQFTVWVSKGWNAIDATSQLTLAVALLLRLADLHERVASLFVSLSAACAVLLWSKLLFFMMPFSSTGVPSAHPKLYGPDGPSTVCQPLRQLRVKCDMHQ